MLREIEKSGGIIGAVAFRERASNATGAGISGSWSRLGRREGFEEEGQFDCIQRVVSGIFSQGRVTTANCDSFDGTEGRSAFVVTPSNFRKELLKSSSAIRQ